MLCGARDLDGVLLALEAMTEYADQLRASRPFIGLRGDVEVDAICTRIRTGLCREARFPCVSGTRTARSSAHSTSRDDSRVVHDVSADADGRGWPRPDGDRGAGSRRLRVCVLNAAVSLHGSTHR
jgi:hypothetical protein